MQTERDILVVDDEQVVLDSIRKITALESWTSDEVKDASSALQQLEERRYKVLITVLMLPGVSGLNLIKVVRAKYPLLPIVMITGYSTIANALESFRHGVFDFIPKPFDIGELQGSLLRAIRFGETGERTVIEKWAKTRNAADRYHFMGCESWARSLSPKEALIGAGEAFPDFLGELSEVQLPEVGAYLPQGGTCARIVGAGDIETIHTIWMPVSGRVMERNVKLLERPALLAQDPFSAGWLVKVEPGDFQNESAILIVR